MYDYSQIFDDDGVDDGEGEDAQWRQYARSWLKTTIPGSLDAGEEARRVGGTAFVPIGREPPACTFANAPHCTVSLHQDINKRPYQEDRMSVANPLPDAAGAALFGVFDGHGGSRASEYVRLAVERAVAMAVRLVAAAEAPDAWMAHEPSPRVVFCLTEIVRLLERGFMRIASASTLKDGTTFNICVVIGHHLYVVNVGDSRTVLCTEGTPIPLSSDHKVSDLRVHKHLAEYCRVLKAGGRVSLGRIQVPNCRLRLSMSRSIGDFPMKANNQSIIADPDIKFHYIDASDEFLVVATDGVWDVMSGVGVVTNVRGRLRDAPADTQLPAHLAQDLLADVARLDTQDNASAIVVRIQQQKP